MGRVWPDALDAPACGTSGVGLPSPLMPRTGDADASLSPLHDRTPCNYSRSDSGSPCVDIPVWSDALDTPACGMSGVSLRGSALERFASVRLRAAYRLRVFAIGLLSPRTVQRPVAITANMTRARRAPSGSRSTWRASRRSQSAVSAHATGWRRFRVAVSSRSTNAVQLSSLTVHRGRLA